MIHLRPIPPEAKRCDQRVKDAIRRETIDCLRNDVAGRTYTPPARFAPQTEEDADQGGEQPWHTYNRD